MIQINLLPVREAKRKANVKQHVLELVLVLIVVVAGIGFVHIDLTDNLETTQNSITQMQNDIEKFKPQLDQVAAFRAKKAELQKKMPSAEAAPAPGAPAAQPPVATKQG